MWRTPSQIHGKEYIDIIKSSIRIPLDYGSYLEVIILRGEGEDVKALTGRIMSLRGVKHVKLNITSLKSLNLKISLRTKSEEEGQKLH